MSRITLPSLIVLITAGCAHPTPPAKADDLALARAEAARARYLALQDEQRPKSEPEFVPVRLERGAYTEGGVNRTGSSTVIRIPRLP